MMSLISEWPEKVAALCDIFLEDYDFKLTGRKLRLLVSACVLLYVTRFSAYR